MSIDYNKAKFSFGERVIIDDKQEAQIIDYYGDGHYTVDINGKWFFMLERRMKKDERFKSPQELNGFKDEKL